MTDYRNEIEPMLTTSEVARILRVHINTVRRWANQGVLTSYRIGSRGDRRFKKVDIDRFCDPTGSNGEVTVA
jgi:excisionase family DNA binding protein